MRMLMASKLNWVLGAKMLVVGMVVGFVLISAYAIPLPPDSQAAGGAAYLTYQSVCTTCHDASRVQNYQGSSSWPEIVELMREFGGFFTAAETEEVIEYLESTYPR